MKKKHHKPTLHHPAAPKMPKVVYVEVVQPFHHMDMNRSWMSNNHPENCQPAPPPPAPSP